MKKYLILIGSIISFSILFISKPANALDLHLNKVGNPNIVCYYSNTNYTDTHNNQCTWESLNQSETVHSIRNIFVYDNNANVSTKEGEFVRVLLTMRDNHMPTNSSVRIAKLDVQGYQLVEATSSQLTQASNVYTNSNTGESIIDEHSYIYPGMGTVLLTLTYQCTTSGGCNNTFSIAPITGTFAAFGSYGTPQGGTLQVLSLQYLSQNASPEEAEQNVYDQQKEDDQQQKENADQSADTAQDEVGGWFSWLTDPIEGFIEPFLPNSTTTCETLPTVSDWLNQPSNTQYCQVFPSKVINVITPFVYLFVGALAIKICLKLIRHLQGGD